MSRHQHSIYRRKTNKVSPTSSNASGQSRDSRTARRLSDELSNSSPAISRRSAGQSTRSASTRRLNSATSRNASGHRRAHRDPYSAPNNSSSFNYIHRIGAMQNGGQSSVNYLFSEDQSIDTVERLAAMAIVGSNEEGVSASSCGPVASASSCGPVASASSCGPVASTSSCGPVASASSCGPIASASSCGPVSRALHYDQEDTGRERRAASRRVSENPHLRPASARPFDKDFFCTNCKIGLDATEVDTHVRSNHLGLFSCHVCEEAFTGKKSANAHQRESNHAMEKTDGNDDLAFMKSVLIITMD